MNFLFSLFFINNYKLNSHFLFHGQMNITLKDVKKQKVTKHLASNNINASH